MVALTELLGPSLVMADGEIETSDALADISAVGLYFASQTDACATFTGELTDAYNGSLKGKGLEVVLVVPPEAEGIFDPMPWLMHPSDGGLGIQALVDKFGATELPKLVILDMEGEVSTLNGVDRVREDAAGEGFPWKEEPKPPELTEDDILVKLGNCSPEAGETDLSGIFINTKNFIRHGFIDADEQEDGKPFTGMIHRRPYVEIVKAAVLEEIQRMGFASDFFPARNEIGAFKGEKLLIFSDPEGTYGQKFVWCTSEASYKRETERIEGLRQAIVDEFEESLKAAAGGAEGGVEGADPDADIVVQDLPRPCGEWKSETAEATHAEVANFTVQNSRKLMSLMITRPRFHFGKPYKFNDAGENLQNCRPHKDPNFALQRRELDRGIQAVKEMKTSWCQTMWFRPVNKSTQYSPADFLKEDKDMGYAQADALSVFLQSVSVGVEEALQTNETVDIFREEFAHLGDPDPGAISQTSSNIREFRNFHDVTFTKGKRIEWVEWVPNSTDMIAASYIENLPFSERLDTAGKATISTILIWSFQESLQPHAALHSPWEVSVFKFWPTDGRYLLGGLSSGQLAIWKLSDADLGHAVREKPQSSGVEEEKVSATPKITHKIASMIDESHKKAVMAIEWLPCTLEMERRGRTIEAPAKDYVKYFATIAGDGQMMIWDFYAAWECINDVDFVWKPVHRIQLQRQDSGPTEMGCGQILYCKDRVDDKGTKHLTNFYAGTEEGELIFGDWAARSDEESRKPEFCKKMFTISKTFRPMLSLERSPFFNDVLLGVTDWAFYLWRDTIQAQELLFQSSYTSTYFTRGCWSPSRPSVIFLGLANGTIDIWDFSDQSHKASLNETGASSAISSMVFLRHAESEKDKNQQKLAVGDAGGNLHVHIIPNNLVKPAGQDRQEYNNMKRFLDREERRVNYFNDRRQQLEELKAKMDREAQMAADKEKEETTKAVADEDKLDQHAEDIYKKLQEECLEILFGTGPPL